MADQTVQTAEGASAPGEAASIPPLSLKHRRFIDEYFNCNMNATEAYFRVYGANRRNGRVTACGLLAKPNIKAEIERRLKENAMGVEEAISRLADMARGNIYPFIRITAEGFVYFNFSDPEARKHMHLIKKIKSKRTRRIEDKEVWEDEWVEVELHDSQAALEKILRMHGKFAGKDPENNLNIVVTVRGNGNQG